MSTTSFEPIAASSLLTFAHDHASVSVVKRVFQGAEFPAPAPFAPSAQLEVYDLSVRDSNRHVSDDAAYLSDRDLWINVARGNAIAVDPVTNNTRVVSRGVRKFFDYSKETIPAGIQTIVSCEKANGECARIAYDPQLKGWWVGSKNVTLFARSKEDVTAVKMYKDGRYTFAAQMAKAWFAQLASMEAAGQSRVEQMFVSLGWYTAVAEFISDNEHVVMYDASERNRFRFFALVPHDGSETCMHPVDAFALFSANGLPVVRHELVSREKLEEHVRSVFLAEFEREGEGRVLYLSDADRRVQLICKAKNQIYWILRAIREQLKGHFSPDRMAEKLRSKRTFLELDDEKLKYWQRLAVDFGTYVTNQGIAVGGNFPSAWKAFMDHQRNTNSVSTATAASSSSVTSPSNDKLCVLFSGIPGCGKDSLAIEIGRVAGLTTSVWTSTVSDQLATECVIISQDALGTRDKCVAAFNKALTNPAITLVMLTRNNFAPRDRQSWLSMAMAHTRKVFLMCPRELHAEDTRLQSVLFLRCVDHVISRRNHPAGLDSRKDAAECAFVDASFFASHVAPTDQECSGVIWYDALQNQQQGLDATLDGAAPLLNGLYQTLNKVVSFKDGALYTRVAKNGVEVYVPANAKGASGGISAVQMMRDAVLPHISQFPGAQWDRSLTEMAKDVWSQLQAMDPAPLYYGLFPVEDLCSAAASFTEWVRNFARVDLHGFDLKPLSTMHVTLAYLGGKVPSATENVQLAAAHATLKSLLARGEGTLVKAHVVEVVCSNEVVAAVVRLGEGSLPAALPCMNAHAHLTIGIRGKVGKQPTAPRHANDMLVSWYKNGSKSGMDADGFHNIHAVSTPAFVLDMKLKAVFPGTSL
jgi:hypothetical protein